MIIRRDLLGWIVSGVLLLYIVFMMPTETKEEIIIPPRINTKVITTPQPITKKDTLVLSGGGVQIVHRENPVNSELLTRYQATKDSLERERLFKDAITERTYIETLEDSVQTITVESDVIGTLREQKISYRTNPVRIKKEPRRALRSASIGSYVILPSRTYEHGLSTGLKLDLEFEKLIISGGYDTDHRMMIGASLKLFD